MLRLIVIIGLVYAAMKVFRFMKRLNMTVNSRVSNRASGKIDDVMIKDPYCDVYFAKRDGVPLKHGSEKIYFCSKECRDNYIKEMAEK